MLREIIYPSWITELFLFLEANYTWFNKDGKENPDKEAMLMATWFEILRKYSVKEIQKVQLKIISYYKNPNRAPSATEYEDFIIARRNAIRQRRKELEKEEAKRFALERPREEVERERMRNAELCKEALAFAEKLCF